MAWQSTSTRQTVSIGSSGGVNPIALTIAAWIEMEDFGTNNVNVVRSNDGRVRFTAQNFAMRFFTRWSSGNVRWQGQSGVFPPIGQLAHVAVTYDGSSDANEAKFYFNGAPISSTLISSPPSGVFTGTSGNYTIGNNSGRTQGYSARHSDFRFYSRELSPQEIETIVSSSGHDGINDSLLVRYPFNERVPGNWTGGVIDVSGSGRNGNSLTSGGTPQSVPDLISGTRKRSYAS